MTAWELHPAGQVRRGSWCEDCALPSIIEQDWVVIDPQRIRTLSRGTALMCTNCHALIHRPREAPAQPSRLR